MALKFGPGGLGPVKDAVSNLERYKEAGLKACEIEFTYSIYIKHDKDMKVIRDAAKRLGIKLSIHAPYWLNLNSKDKKKVSESKKRILKCCEVGEKLGVYMVVFHPGYYSGMGREEAYKNIKKEILDMQKVIKKKRWKIKIGPEIMGRVNVFGSIDDIARLVEETKCGFCIDYAHILARDKKVDYSKINKLFDKHNSWHLHFSGIVYGEKGEKNHIKTKPEEWRELLKNLPKNKEISIINESPEPFEDSVEGLRISKKL
jgi:deoxyribonuclease-4